MNNTMTDDELNAIKARAAEVGTGPFHKTYISVYRVWDVGAVNQSGKNIAENIASEKAAELLVAALFDRAALLAEVERLREGDREARDLLKVCAPEVKPLGESSGVISQLSNFIAGQRGQVDQLRANQSGLSINTQPQPFVFVDDDGDTTRGDG